MRVRCLKASRTRTRSLGFFKGSEEYEEAIDGLTEGKIYEVYPIITCNNSTFEATDTSRTEINFSDISFLLWNDNEEWDFFEKGLFAPEAK